MEPARLRFWKETFRPIRVIGDIERFAASFQSFRRDGNT
jgi:hypothetical protein